MKTLLSLHAQERLVDTNITHSDVDFIVSHAKLHRNAGVGRYELRHKDLGDDAKKLQKYQRLIGVTVLACKYCGLYIITVYRPYDAKADKRKRKYDAYKRPHICPCCNS